MYQGSMRRRKLIANLGSICLLSAAGCSESSDSAREGTRSNTVSDTDTTADSDSTATGENSGGETAPDPPGVDASGAVDGESLADAHERLLVERSVTLRIEREYDGFLPTTERVAAGDDVVHSVVESDDTHLRNTADELRTETWQTSEETYYHCVGNGTERTYRANSRVDRLDLLQAKRVRAILQAGAFEAVGTETVDGQPVRVLEADGTNGDDIANLYGNSRRDVDGFEATARVTDAGLVAVLDVAMEVTGVIGGDLTATYEYVDLGTTTVDEPAWLDGSEPTAMAVSATDDHLALRHAGGAPLPADATVSVIAPEVGGAKRLEERVVEGDTVYVAGGEGEPVGDAFVTVNDPPAEGSAPISGSVRILVDGVPAYELSIESATDG